PMRSRRSTRTSMRPREPERGFSVIELMVSLAVAGVALASVATFFSQQTRRQQGQSYRVEVQQALRTSLDTITRDIRLAGACLPGSGQFVSFQATDDPNGDSLTIRSGVAKDDFSCLVAPLTAQLNSGTRTAQVTNGTSSGFTSGMYVYLCDTANVNGQYSYIT